MDDYCIQLYITLLHLISSFNESADLRRAVQVICTLRQRIWDPNIIIAERDRTTKMIDPSTISSPGNNICSKCFQQQNPGSHFSHQADQTRCSQIWLRSEGLFIVLLSVWSSYTPTHITIRHQSARVLNVDPNKPLERRTVNRDSCNISDRTDQFPDVILRKFDSIQLNLIHCSLCGLVQAINLQSLSNHSQ